MVREKVSKDNIIPILVSLALSFMLWLVVSGQKMTTVDLTVPLELAGLPPNLYIGDEVPTAVNVKIQANPAQMRIIEDRKLRINIDASGLKPGDNVFEIDAQTLDLPRGVIVRKVTPEMISFHSEELQTKIFKVNPVIKGRVADYYELKDLKISPEAVQITGPRDKLAQVKNVNTSTIDLTGRDQSADLLVLPLPETAGLNLKIEPRELKAHLEIEEIRIKKTVTAKVEVIFQTPVTGVGIPGFKAVPDSVKIGLSAAAVDQMDITADCVKAYVEIKPDDLSAVAPKTLSLPVKIKPAAGIRIESLEPKEITVQRLALPPAPVFPAP